MRKRKHPTKHILLKYRKQKTYPKSKCEILNKFREIVDGLFKSLIKYQTKRIVIFTSGFIF